MSSIELLEQAQSSGVKLLMEGSRLAWSANQQPSTELLAQLKLHQREIIEILSTLSGTPPKARVWLGRVADMLGCSPFHLVTQGFIDRHDLEEQTHHAPEAAANLIRSDPRWQRMGTVPGPAAWDSSARDIQFVIC